jgi:hypothetical protein
METMKHEAMKDIVTVQDLIDELSKVPDKTLPVYAWINSDTPEPTFHGTDRVPITHVDTDVRGMIDVCIGYKK